MIKQKDNNAVCDIMYNIRDAINDNESIRALSLANDLYFMLLRAAINDQKLTCDPICKGEDE